MKSHHAKEAFDNICQKSFIYDQKYITKHHFTQVRTRACVQMNTLLSGSKGVVGVTVKQATVLRFREIMEERSMTPNELANLSGVTPSTVYS